MWVDLIQLYKFFTMSNADLTDLEVNVHALFFVGINTHCSCGQLTQVVTCTI